MIRIPCAESGPILPGVKSEDIEASWRKQLEWDEKLIELIMGKYL